MSRANSRRSQNAASLIRPSMVVKVCADCGAYAVGCYDMEQVKIGDYCPQHAKERGFCTRCGSQLTELERRGMSPLFGSGLCGSCQPHLMHRIDFDDDELDDTYYDEDDE